MTTPALDAAIKSACGDDTCRWSRCRNEIKCRIGMAHPVQRALRSLATPTPEVIEAMARAINADRAGNPDTERWREYVEDAQAAHAAEWALILGETK